ncbi:hypothetical protein [Lacrimispora indolis]|uniref:hypothetical protein n=1 Tax=Lacrimispora indolis TaxID=69825 RepID=UPI00045E60F5|nr:hypothetical protein [Lacrimispora indolis]
MSENKNIQDGYWAIAAEKHLKNYIEESQNLDEVDNLNIAGKSGRFLGTIRGNGTIENIKKIEKMAGSVGIRKSTLHKIILPEIERASDKIEIIRNTIGEITGIAEYLFDSKNVLGIAGEVFENQNPNIIEKIAIETMEATKKLPYYQGEIIDKLIKNGYKEQDIQLSIAIQEQFQLIQKVNLTKTKDPIISNEYIWGENHKKIAAAIAPLDFGKKQTLKDVIEIVQNKQGIPLEQLPNVDAELLQLAKKVGILNPTIISSSRGFNKEFEFSTNLLHEDSQDKDILDDVKLLLASIRFGENYTEYSTINDSAKFLRALINRGTVGPHSSNGTDYLLLEKRGIVKVEKRSKYNYYTRQTREGYCLKLLKQDIAEEALRIIESKEYSIKLTESISDCNIISECGSFDSPEETRVKMGLLPEPVRAAQEHLNKVLRDELI